MRTKSEQSTGGVGKLLIAVMVMTLAGLVFAMTSASGAAAQRAEPEPRATATTAPVVPPRATATTAPVLPPRATPTSLPIRASVTPPPPTSVPPTTVPPTTVPQAGTCGPLTIDVPIGPHRIGIPLEVGLYFAGCDVTWGIPQYTLTSNEQFGSVNQSVEPGGSTQFANFTVIPTEVGLGELQASVNFERSFFRPDGTEFFAFAGATADPVSVEVEDSAQLLADLDRARTTWEAANPDGGTYTLNYLINCFCFPQSMVEVVVEDGVLVSATDNGEPASRFNTRTVPQMFDDIEEAINTAFRVVVNYDPDTGVPMNYYIDEVQMIADEEREFVITSYTPGPVAPNPLVALLADARGLWEAENPDGGTYVMDYTINCFCFFPEGNNVTVEVVDGVVVEATQGRNTPATEFYVKTVPQMFDEIADALVTADSVTATFDPDTGVPMNYFIDPEAMLADEEIGYTITSYTPGPAGPDPLEQELIENLALWESTAPQSYSLRSAVFCFCRPAPAQTAWVHNGEIVELKTEDGMEAFDDVRTVAEAFAEVEAAISSQAFRVDVTYNDEYGYPEFLSVDLGEFLTDDVITHRFDNFIPDDNVAFEIYYAQVAAELQEAPGSEYSMYYTRSCTLVNRCSRAEAAPAVIGVDVQQQASSLFGVTGFTPADTPHPTMSLQDMVEFEWLPLLDQATTLLAAGVPVDLDATYDGELVFLRSYSIKFATPDTGAQSLSVTVDEFGPYGCCTQGVGGVVVYSENFEGDVVPAWDFGPDTARTGHFSVGAPQETRFRGQVVQPGVAAEGERALISDPRGGGRVGRFDIDRGRVQAISPGIALPGDAATLTFDYFYSHPTWPDANDFLRVSVVSEDTGESKEMVFDQDLSGQWRQASMDLGWAAGQRVYINVVAADEGRGSLVEAGIDNVEIITNGQTSQATVWSETFEAGDDAWTVSGPARTGAWGASAPRATSWYGDALQQGAASEGSQALVTDGRRGWRAGSYDVDGGATIAVSSPIFVPVNVLPASYTLSFDWYFTHLANTTDADSFTVEILPADARPITVLSVTGTPAYRPNDWDTTSFDITRFQGRQIQIRVTATDGGPGSLIEAGIDDIKITTENLPFPILPPEEGPVIVG